MGDPTVNLVDDTGRTITVPVSEAGPLLASETWRPETGADIASRAEQNVEADIYGGPAGTVVAGAAGVARGVTGGASDALVAGLGGGEKLRKLQRQNPTVSAVGEIGGSLLPIGVGGLAARAGEKAAGLIRGGGAVSQIARAGVGAGVEGAIQGVGSGVSQVALSEEPLDIEHMAAAIGSNALFGGAVGGGVGAAGKGLGLGLRRAKAALDDAAGKGLGRAGLEPTADLAKLDAKGLRAARDVELTAIEEARIPQRAQLADEIKAFRTELKENKLWLATKGAEESEIRAIGKRTLKADRALDNLLDDPKALAESPKAALSHLRKQEAALDELVNKHGPSLREKFAADTSGTRATALDFASTALERNRGLQAKLTEVSARPTSQRLTAIADALDMRAMPKADATIGEALGASALGHAVGMAAGVPYLGQAVLAGKAIMGVAKKLGANSAVAAERASKAISTFLDVGSKIAPSAPVLASKVLANVAFSHKRSKAEGDDMAASYRARAEELRSQMQPGPDGKPQMNSQARTKMAESLAPVRALSPLAADKIESTKVRGLEFLADKMPRRPDVAGVQIGPDKWQPSDMAMREWARYVAAVEDPHGVVERLASGTVTPEDAEAMRTVYPEIYADIQMQIMASLGELRASLPYQRRLALSIFSDVAVDPALDPRILNILQGTYAREEGSEEGTQAPRAAPQFGSVKAESPTPAQERAS